MTDALHAKASFYLSLGFWVPLFNVGFTLVSIALGVAALRRIAAQPKRYGGFGFAVAGLVISTTGILLTAVGLALYLFSPAVCSSALCASP